MNNITIEDMQQMQTDNYNVFAEIARPLLLSNLNRSKLTKDEASYIDILGDWNLRNDINEQGATIFKVFWDSVEVSVFGDEFSQTQLPLRWPDESALVENLLKGVTYKFIDDISTRRIETLNEIVLRAYKKAYKELRKAGDEGKLAWGKFKDTGVRHLLKIPALNRLHLPIGGGDHIINATKSTHGASWRMVVQLTTKIEAYGVYPGGQSGNPGSKYYDMFIDTWANGKYYPLLFINEDEAKRSSQIKWATTFSKG
jgi:penicillin amidase